MSSCLWWPPNTALVRILPPSLTGNAVASLEPSRGEAGGKASGSAKAAGNRGGGDASQQPQRPCQPCAATEAEVTATGRQRAEAGGSRGDGASAAATEEPARPEISQWRGYTVKEVLTMRQQIDLSNWEKGGETSRYAFQNASSLFSTAVVRRRGPVRDLAYSLNSTIADFPIPSSASKCVPFDQYVEHAAIDGIIIVHKGKIAYEKYPRMRQDDRHLLFSVGKVVVSTLVAILEDRGRITTRLPIEHYIPELANTGWHGVPVIDILDMASGIDAPEEVDGAYTDPEVKTYQFEASLGWLPKIGELPKSVHREATYEFLAELDQAEEPGQAHDYASVNTMVLAWLVERVTGRSFADVLSEEIWGRMGAEADGLVTVNSRGIAAVHGGIISTLHDLARFGLLFTPSCEAVCSEPIVSAACLRKIREEGRPELMPEEERTSSGVRHSTYQWDQVWEDGSFFKSGFGNQGLYVHPDKDLLVAFFGTHGYGEELLPVPEDVCREMLCKLY